MSLITLPADVDRLIFSHISKPQPNVLRSMSLSLLIPLRCTCRKFRELIPRPARAALSLGLAAIDFGSRNLLQWAVVQGFYLDSSGTTDVCRSAGLKGHAEVLHWLHDHVARLPDSVIDGAAEGGHLELLEWLYASGYPVAKSTCTLAAASGKIEVLAWMKAMGCLWNDGELCHAAAKNADMGMLEWLLVNGCDLCSPDACRGAAESGSLEVLKWLHKNGCTPDARTAVAAAGNGNMGMLEWVAHNGCKFEDLAPACSVAARKGHLEVLQWLRSHNCPWPKEIPWPNSPSHGIQKQREIITWTILNGAPPHRLTMRNIFGPYEWAAYHGYYDMLQLGFDLHPAFMAVNVNLSTIAASAARGGQFEIMQKLAAKGAEFDITHTAAAAHSGRLDLLNWLVERGCKLDSNAMQEAVQQRHFDVLKWVRKD